MARAISPRKFGQELGEALKAKLIDPSMAEPQYCSDSPIDHAESLQATRLPKPSLQSE